MIDGLRLYLRYVGISVRTQLAYRVSLAMFTVGQLLVTGIEFLAIWALFHRFGSLRGWTLPEVALFYGITEVSFAIADAGARGYDQVPQLVKTGALDRLLLRPRSLFLQLVGQELTLRRVGRLAQGAAVLGWASGAAGISWSAAKMALLLCAVAGGVCLYAGVMVVQAAMSFWTVETLELWNAFSYGGTYAAQYPIAIYRRFFRRFLTYVLPLACVNYFPGLALLGKTDPLGSPPYVQWLAPLAGVAFLVVALQAWKLGLRRYSSTGS
jgi:viologen exporter family transport system permease protein